jgi:hypothetical protein
MSTLLRALLALSLLCVLVSAHAIDSSLYVGEALVGGQDEAEREKALPQALAQALVRASGDAGLVNDPALAGKLGVASTLMRLFSYRVVSEPDVSGALTQRLYLVVQFDPAGIAALLNELKRPLWGERPPTLVWLMVDSGGPKTIAGAAQVQALLPFTRPAELRGIPLKFPLMDIEDQSRLDPAMAWDATQTQILAASQRYGTPLVFVVKLSRNGPAWNGKFTLIEQYGAASTESWNTAYSDAASVLQSAAVGLADRLAARYAASGVQTKPTEYRVWVEGLKSAADYGRVTKYLAGVTGVRGLETEAARDDRLLLRLTLTMTLERFKQVLEFEHRLNVVALESAAGAPARLALPPATTRE